MMDEIAKPECSVEKRIIVPSISESLDQKWSIMVMGTLGVIIILAVYFMYRFIRGINQRLHSLEEILAKVIEKNNHLQHMIQASATRYVAQPTVDLSSPQPPPPPSPPAPVNLDKEILEELRELESVPMVPVVAPPKVVKANVNTEIISEGRIDEIDIGIEEGDKK